MTIRFLADEDLKSAIIEGLKLREPSIDILDAKDPHLRESEDPELLELAAVENRIIVSHDSGTMTLHFRRRLAAGKHSPGLFIVPQWRGIGEVIESLLLIWGASEPDEWRDQLTYIPYPK